MFWVLGRYQTCGVQVPSRLRVAVAVAVAFAARCSASMECADLCCLCLWWPPGTRCCPPRCKEVTACVECCVA